jgi:hypothetical protein
MNSRKRYSSLIVYLTILEMVNRVIEKGLVEDKKVKEVERFLIGLSFIQYFKCYTFGHIALGFSLV